MSSFRRGALLVPAIVLAFALATLPAPAQTGSSSKGAPPKAAPAPAVRAEKRVPYQVGERLSYDVSWASYVTAATLSLSVDAKVPTAGSTAYRMTAEAQTVGLLAKLFTLYYKADTLLDAYTLLPRRGSLYSREGGAERTKTTTFDHPAGKALFEMQTTSKMQKEVTLAPRTQDLLSAIYALRALPLQPGDKFEMPVSDSGWMYQATFVVGAAEAVKRADGSMVQALRVTPQIINEQGQPTADGFVMWLSSDPSHTPVRMEGSLAAGRIILALK
jgi:hypothetical protein